MRNLLLLFLAIALSFAAKAQVPCQAGFTYTTNGLSVTFTSTSTYPSSNPNLSPTQYLYHGAGSPTYFWGSTTVTYPAPGTYPVVAMLYIIDSSTVSVVCTDNDTQYVTVSLPPCSVSISKVQSGNTVTFTANNLAGTAGMTYNWNFGDGNTGTGSPVTHTYAQNGGYTAYLTGSSTSANCSKTVFTGVNINVPVNKISGYVIADSSSIDTFKVWLIQFDSTTNILYAVDSTIVSNTFTNYPIYTFNNNAAGHYRTKAHQLDGPTSGTGYLPTYHANSLFWNTATVFYHGGGNTQWKDIYMQMGTVTGGPGFVGGNVTLGANKGTSNGIEGQLVFLRDNTGKVIAMDFTDSNGDYLFTNLPLGDYSVYPEEGGYTITPASINLNNVFKGSYNVHFEKHEASQIIVPKSTSVGTVHAQNTFSLYPNPTNGLLYVELGTANTEVVVSIADITGKNVYQQELLANGTQKIDVAHLKAGNYLITIKNNGQVATQKFTIDK